MSCVQGELLGAFGEFQPELFDGPTVVECAHARVRQVSEFDVECLDCGAVSA